MHVQTYDLARLVSAYVNAQRYQNAAPELRNYWSRLSLTLQLLLNVGIDQPFTERLLHMEEDENALVGILALFRNTVSSLLSISTPFAGFVEAPPVVYKRYREDGPKFHAKAREYRKMHENYLVVLLQSIYGDVSTVVTSEDLREAGFDDSQIPDPYDFD